MAWQARNDFTTSDRVYNTDLNKLANDDRNWGGNVNAGGYQLSNLAGLFLANVVSTGAGAHYDGTSVPDRAFMGMEATSNFSFRLFGTQYNGNIWSARLDTGQIGFGTSGPISRVHISVAANDGLTVSSLDNSLKGIIFNNSGTSITLGTTTNHPVVIYVNNAEKVRFLTSGGVSVASLPSSNPGAGSKQLWYDPADGNRVKYAA